MVLPDQFQPSVQPSPSLSRFPAFAVPGFFEVVFEDDAADAALEPAALLSCALKSDCVSEEVSFVLEFVPVCGKSSEAVTRASLEDVAPDDAPPDFPRQPESTIAAIKAMNSANKTCFFIVFTVFLHLIF